MAILLTIKNSRMRELQSTLVHSIKVQSPNSDMSENDKAKSK